jgi:hypothetical protein
MAFINQTTPERFKSAQAMLEKALAAEPDNVDLQAALSAHLLRGVQSAWYNRADVAAAESSAQAMIERALRSKPTYLPVLEGYCRFLAASNHFVESLVACAKALTFDPRPRSAHSRARGNPGQQAPEFAALGPAFAGTSGDEQRFNLARTCSTAPNPKLASECAAVYDQLRKRVAS